MAFDDVAPVLRRITSREPVSWTARDEGAYSYAARWVVTWADGGTAFVKAEAEPDDSHGVGVEHRVLSNVSAPFLPALVAYDAGPPGVLVTEDLSHARWGTPLTVDDVTALRDALDLLADVRAPDGLGPVDATRRWAAFQDDPAPLLATGLAERSWLAHLDALAAAEAAADTTGDRLLHGDLWLQNWCRTDRGAVFVDWSGSHRGNPLVSRAWAEGGVRAADGPAGIVLPPGSPEWAAWLAGQAAYFLTEVGPRTPPRLVETERREALATLRWACDELGLPHPARGPAFAGLGPWRP